MFGYVRPLREEMKVRDWELWRQHYCGLCRCLGKRYGLKARFLLSYDMTFLYSLLSMKERQKPPKKCWCPAGVVCRKACSEEDPAMLYAADLTVLLTWWKLQDERKDGRFLHRWGAGALLLLFRRAYRRAEKRQPEFAAVVQQQLQLLQELEQARSDSIDRTADAFAVILKSCAEWWKNPGEKRAAGQLLYHVGRYVYLADALDDLREDCRKDRYNPLRYRFRTENGALLPEDKSYLLEILDASVDMAASAFELLERTRCGAVPENIIYYGLPAVLKAVSEGRFNARKKQVKS